MKLLFFCLVILLANIIQGITGFAGTILAMPFSLRLVGMGTAVPVLNSLGIVSGIYVLSGNYRYVNKKELLRVCPVMGAALVIGLLIRGRLMGNPRILYCILGVLVIAIGLRGLIGALKKKEKKEPGNLLQWILLIAAGAVHGMFVCGGPLLIGYLSSRIKEKDAFRATISAVWMVLNGILLIAQILGGDWSLPLLKVQLLTIPFLLGGMYIGFILYRHMSQRLFMILTYILLLIAGITLFFK